MQAAIGIDIGGTKLSVGLVAEDGRVLHLERQETPPDGQQAIKRLLAMTARVLQAAQGRGLKPVTQAPARADNVLLGIGIGFGGPVNFPEQSLVRSHHVAGWTPGLKLGEHFATAFGLPTLMDNDANCGGLGEAIFGAGRGYSSLVYVNVGTGIGGAILFDGRVHHGAHSLAGEIGHTVVLPDGPPCTCDKRGCLEALSSGSAIGREGRAAGLGDATGKDVGERAQAGDPLARRIVAQAGHWLGVALGNVANLLDPELFIVGGGVASLGEIYLQPTREAFLATAMPQARGTPIVPARFGYDAGVIGAATLLLASAREER